MGFLLIYEHLLSSVKRENMMGFHNRRFHEGPYDTKNPTVLAGPFVVD